MDHTTQWAQGIGFLKKPMEEEELLHSSINSEIRAPILSQQQVVVERKQRPHKEQALLHCPRCNSTNTKFCYYNNYSLTQPRYFCKTCRRYWTEGGSLRNVPVGGGSRKNKRHSSNSNSNSSSSKILTPPPPPQISITSTSCHQPFDQVRDLNLTFPNVNPNPNPNPNHGYDMNNNINNSGGLSAMELLRSTGIAARGVGPPLVPMGNGLYNFDGIMQEGNSRRVLFPFGEHRGQVGENPMFWNGMMGGGSGSW